MRSDTLTVRRVRVVIVLAVAGAVTVMLGVILVIVGAGMRFITRHPVGRIVSLGVDVAVVGIAFGLVVLVVFAFMRAGASAISGRRRRKQVVNPTTVYSPGGLLDVPREARAPGASSPAGAPVAPDPGRLRPPVPSAQAGARPARPGAQPARPGAQPARPGAEHAWPGGQPAQASRPEHGFQERRAHRPGNAYPPGAVIPPGAGYPMESGTSQVPRVPGGQPLPPLPPQDRPRSRGPMPRPGTPAPPPGAPATPRGAPPPPRGTPAPPPGAPSPGPSASGPGAGTRPHPGPGYTVPPGRRPGPPEPPEPPRPRPRPGPADAPPAQFDGGYAYVIRATDVPVRPAAPGRPGGSGGAVGSGRPAGAGGAANAGSGHPAAPGTPGPEDVFVYRDPDLATAPRDEDNPAYWYDLPADDEAPAAPAVVKETRGPFEPLVSSSGPPRSQLPAAPAEPEGTSAERQDARGASADDGREDPASARARKLEQLKDLYLTAEAIGEDNVGRHFDELLTQQHALIDDYFKQSPAAKPEADPGPPGSASDQVAGSGSPQDAPQPGPAHDNAPADQPRT